MRGVDEREVFFVWGGDFTQVFLVVPNLTTNYALNNTLKRLINLDWGHCGVGRNVAGVLNAGNVWVTPQFVGKIALAKSWGLH